MAKETKVIHVHLIFKKTSRFFGSISAIYSEFTAEAAEGVWFVDSVYFS